MPGTVGNGMTAQASGRQVILDESYQVEYWTATLRVSEVDLRLAVAQVGTAEAEVRAFLSRQV